MPKVEKLDLGTKTMHSYKGSLLWNYFSLFERQVSVPVTMQTSMFVFDFKQTAERIFGPDVSDDKLRRLIAMLAAATDKLDDDVIQQAFDELGISTSDDEDGGANIRDLSDKIRDHITSSIARSGISPLLFKDVLSGATESVQFEDFRNLNLAEITLAVETVQTLYSMFVRSSSVAEIAAFIREEFFNNKFLEMTRILLKTMNYESNASVMARTSYVLDETFRAIYDVPFVEMSPKFTGKVYQIEDVFLPELNFAEMIGGVVISIRSLAGMPWSTEESTLKLDDVVTQMVTGVGQLSPFVPAEVGDIDIDRVSQFMERITLKHALERILTNDFGQFENRVMSVINERKYLRDDAYDEIIRDGVRCASILFEAFLDTGASMKYFALSDDIFYPEIHPVLQREIRDFTFNMLGEFKNFSLPMENPRFYNEPAHMINQTVSYDFNLPEFVLSDDDRKNAKSFVLGAQDEEFLKVYTSGLDSGDIWDLDTVPIGRRMLNNADLVQPTYRYTFAVTNDILRSEAVRYTFGLIPYKDVVAKLDFAKDLLEKGTLKMFKSAFEMSMIMRMPLELAESMFEKYGDDLFLDLTAHNDLLFYFAPELFKIREVKELGDKVNRVKPFIANWPAFMTEKDASFPLGRIGVTLDDVTTNPKPPKPAKAKDKVPESDEASSDADQTVDDAEGQTDSGTDES